MTRHPACGDLAFLASAAYLADGGEVALDILVSRATQ